ncbi:hypothetical protein [Cohnella fermenti]|uniref:SHOCT domain-containing protein n=1 Tax=Cohnella fermenti TaxID=2565925 RepID=A0A4S4BSP3_9BACL|nr:hypothetical protein [Cohnella fermenti]THF78076.1 hypothetical protein E6C55_15390 [Cohnella fermenti]
MKKFATQRWVAACTIALMLAMSSGMATASAQTGTQTSITRSPVSPSSDGDLFLLSLGAKDDDEVRDALQEGSSLADIAASAGADVRPIIELQIRQLTEQLEQRLASGSITSDQFQAYRDEIPSLIEASAYESYTDE